MNDNFRFNWKLFKKKKLTKEMEHRLFVNYVTAMKRCIAAYMDPNLRRSLREDTIAQSLAWGGLEKTPEWKSQKDTNLMKCINMKAQSLNALNVKFNDSCCEKPELKGFLDQLNGIFKITKPATKTNIRN